MVAHICNLDVGEFIWTGGDCHIYNNHIEQVRLQLEREPRLPPSIILNPQVKDIDDFTFDDITLVDYNPQPTIKGKVSV